MKIKSLVRLSSILLLVAVLFSGCRLTSVTTADVPLQTDLPVTAEPQSMPTTQPRATSQPTALPEPTQDPNQVREQGASQAAQAYFAAVSEGKTEDAADLISSFSLMFFQITRGDAIKALQAQEITGVSWADFKILDVQPFDEQTVLVHVTYAEKGSDTPTASVTPQSTEEITSTPSAESGATTNSTDMVWPMRLERGEWFYNWNNVIDFHTLSVEAQTTNEITILPTQLIRYSDRIQLTMLVQNRSNAIVVFDQVNETLGTFSFGDKQVIAENTRWVLSPLSTLPGATLEIRGLFTDLPDKVEIRKWNNYEVKPWFVFQL